MISSKEQCSDRRILIDARHTLACSEYVPCLLDVPNSYWLNGSQQRTVVQERRWYAQPMRRRKR